MKKPGFLLIAPIFLTASTLATSASVMAGGSSEDESSGTVVSQEKLDELGFVRPGTTIDSDGYAQLIVAVVLPEQGNTIHLSKCPKKGRLWNIDLGSLTKGDTTATLGLTISGPIIPSSTYAPIVISVKSKGFLMGSSCVVEIDPVRYRSPLFGVRQFSGRDIKVEPVFSTSKKLSAEVRASVSKLAGGLAVVSGVSAVSAAPYLSTLDGELEALGFDNKERVAEYFHIGAGSVGSPVVWVVPDVLMRGKGDGVSRPAFVVAQLVPVKSAISKPSYLSQWRPGAVLSSPYRTSASTVPGSDSLSGYLYSIAGKEIDDYNSAAPQAANQACRALANRVDGIGMSEADAALVMWALSRSRIDKGVSTENAIDGLSCLNERWEALKAVGIEKPQDIGSPVAPSRDQMMAMSYNEDDLAVFFVTESWEVRKALASRLFSYPLSYVDRSGRMMVESTVIEGREGWVANAFSKDTQMLEKFGCYAYFEGVEDHPFLGQAGRSVMVGFGELPTLTSGQRKEVMLQLNFAPIAIGEKARIDAVVVHEEITEEVRLKAVQRYLRLNKCVSGYRPKLLFRDES